MTELVAADFHGLTDKGRVRKANEDQYVIGEISKSVLIHETSLSPVDQTKLIGLSQGTLFAVADGLGGHGGGDVASRIALETITSYFLNMKPWFMALDPEKEERLDALRRALEESQVKIKRAASEGATGHEDMGSTLTMAYCMWPALYLVHAGDSRCYLFRSSRLKQLTRDHTVAQELVDRGAMDEADAENSKWSNVLVNLVAGGEDKLHPEVHKLNLEYGDRILLCTDGLTAHLDDDFIATVLEREDSSESACEKLVGAANELGGKDNITVIVSSFQKKEEE